MRVREGEGASERFFFVPKHANPRRLRNGSNLAQHTNQCSPGTQPHVCWEVAQHFCNPQCHCVTVELCNLPFLVPQDGEQREGSLPIRCRDDHRAPWANHAEHALRVRLFGLCQASFSRGGQLATFIVTGGGLRVAAALRRPLCAAADELVLSGRCHGLGGLRADGQGATARKFGKQRLLLLRRGSGIY